MTHRERVKAAHYEWYELEKPILHAAKEFDVNFEDILKYHRWSHPIQWLTLEASALWHRWFGRG